MARDIEDWEIVVFEGPMPSLVSTGDCIIYESKKAGLFRYEVFGDGNVETDFKDKGRYIKARGTESTLIDIICELAILKSRWSKYSQNTK